jgi:hypothetical protein
MSKATVEAYSIGRNVSMSRDGNIITAIIDLSVEAPLSTSGKTESIATTGAAADIGSLDDGRPVKMNISVYAPIPASRAVEAAEKQAAVKTAKEAAAAAKAA